MRSKRSKSRGGRSGSRSAARRSRERGGMGGCIIGDGGERVCGWVVARKIGGEFWDGWVFREAVAGVAMFRLEREGEGDRGERERWAEYTDGV